MIAADIVTRLRAAISADVGGRIYAGQAPDAVVTPLCVYNVLSRKLEHDMDGPTIARDTHVQVDVYADTFSVASPIAEKVVTSLGSWRVLDQPNTITVTVDDAGTDMVENTIQPNLKRVSMRFVVHHNNA